MDRRVLPGTVLACVLLALVLAGCGEMQRRDLRSAASSYLDCEVKGQWSNQFMYYDSATSRLLFSPYDRSTYPLRPASITSYQIKEVMLEGNKARVGVTLTVEASDPYQSIRSGSYDVELLYMDQSGHWVVDELNTRIAWIDKLKGKGFGAYWLRQLQSAAAIRRR